MWENIVGKELRRGARNLIWTHILLIVIVCVLALANEKFLYNLVSGPAKTSPEALAAIKDPGAVRRYYVTVKGEKSVESGMQEIEQTKSKYSNEVKSERVTAGFAVLFVGKHLLIVKHGEGAGEQTQVTGTLETIPDEVRSNVIDDAAKEEPGVKAFFLPYMLDASSGPQTAFGWGGWSALVVGVLVLLFSARKLTVARGWTSDISTHPDARSLEKYGTPRDVSEQIDSDVRKSQSDIGSIRLSSKWLLLPTTYGMTIMSLGDLVWAYQKTVQHRTNFIPTGKTYQVLIFDRHAQKIEHQMSEQNVQQFLLEISARAPWTVLGFDQEIERAWNRDRAGFIGAVDERKREIARAAASEPGVPPRYPTT